MIRISAVFDWITILFSLLLGVGWSLLVAAYTGQRLGDVLKSGLWTAIPFAFCIRTFFRISMKRRYKRLPFTYLTSIGYYLRQWELLQLLQNVLTHGHKIDIQKGQGGEYYCLSQRNGIELWTAVNRGNEVQLLFPFFRGTNRNRLKITEPIGNRSDGYEGAFLAWRGEERVDPEGFPLVFSVPDFACHATERIPFMAEVMLTAFASSLQLYSNEAEYLEKQGDGYRIAVRSFFASGMLRQDTRLQTRTMPAAQAVFTGSVNQSKYLVNEETGLQFLWLQVDTLNLAIEVVADRRLLKRLPAEGSIIKVTGWLTGDWSREDEIE